MCWVLFEIGLMKPGGTSSSWMCEYAKKERRKCYLVHGSFTALGGWLEPRARTRDAVQFARPRLQTALEQAGPCDWFKADHDFQYVKLHSMVDHMILFLCNTIVLIRPSSTR